MAKAGNNLAKSFLPTHKKLINPNKAVTRIRKFCKEELLQDLDCENILIE
jgi:hypothetical protein